MRNLRLFIAVVLLVLATNVYADPQLTSWLTAYSGQYSRVYTNTTDEGKGLSATIWTNQTLPAYADIANVYYSANWIYIRFPDLASYTMGPWLTPQGGIFQFWPVNQHGIAKFPRNPSAQSGNKTITGTGYSGNYVNGVAIFNFTDGKAWDGGAIVSGPHNKPTYYWHRNAPIGEGFNFDNGMGHQNPSGVYHTHENPIGLRYELGDHVSYNSSSKAYSESTNTVTTHSPIVGWSYDGYPIYGPYGYSVSNSATSGVRRMVSGYVERDGSSGTDNVSNNLSIIPAWYARFRQAHFNEPYSTTAGTNRASVNSTYPIGTFAEDYSYLADVTNPVTGKVYVQGTDFDLDEYNGRWCVTPDFPSGTYAYFIDIDTNGDAYYPYVFAYEFYGVASGSNGLSSITESVTTNFMGGPDSTMSLSTPTYNSTNSVVTLVWSSVDGGTYSVNSSTNDSTWTNQKTGVASQGISTTTNYTSSVTVGTAYAQVTRTALASYDDTGGGSGVVAQTATQSFQLGNTPPAVLNPISNQTATYGASFSYTFASNTFTDSNAGLTLTYSASSPVFTNTGISFNSSTRTFSATTVDATNGGTITGGYTVQVIATDNGTPQQSATNSFTLTINQASASVTPNSALRSYGGANPAFGGTLSGFVAADSIGASYATTATTNSAPGSYPISATLSDPGSRLGNYTVTTNTGTLTISKAGLTVAANNASRGYGSTNPIFTVTYTGFTNGQTLATSAVSGSPALTTAAATNSAVGSYAITNSVGTLSSANYSFTLVNGSLTVTQAALSVTASNASRAYGVTNPTFTGAIAGLVNNDAITATYTSAASTNSSPGTYNISPVLSDPGSKLGNYTVTTNLGTLTVSKASLLVTANSTSRTYGATNPVFTASYSGFANGETSSSGTISGTPSLATSAATNSSIGSYTITNSIGTLASSDYSISLANGTLSVTQAFMTVTANSVSRAYGVTNPVLTGTIVGLANNDNITASYATTATTNSAIGSYPITVALSDPGSKLGNYSVITNNGILTVTNASGKSNSTFTLSLTNSLIHLATNGTLNYTFTDPNSGLAVVVAVTMTPYSSSNASPAFTLLDFYGANGTPVHLAVDSGLGSGDGNWVNSFEGINFSASVVSASSGIQTNTIEFGIADLGIRPDGGAVSWTSSAATNGVSPSSEILYGMDTNDAALKGATYTGKLRGNGSSTYYQMSDGVTSLGGLVLNASFFEGTGVSATMSSPSVSNNQLQFSVSGTAGASYIVEVTTNLTSPVWVAVSTNTAPFSYTATNAAAYSQRYYRIVLQ